MITVLRLGHRRGRDDRISSHVGLTARQFGADRIIYSGERDKNMLESTRDLAERWGGEFDVQYRGEYRRIIKDFDGLIVHLTMYGERLGEVIDDVRRGAETVEDVLIIVGGEKVPSMVYDHADYNIGVGNQPHSEVAAVAVFLHEFFEGTELDREFEGAEIRVEPQEKGKKTVHPG